MDYLITKMLAFFLVSTRITAFMFAVPVFGWRTIPLRVKAGLIMSSSIFFAIQMPTPFDGSKIGFLVATLMLVQQAIYGLALGLICNFLFAAVRIAARIAERQMGMTMANILDPLTGDQGQPLGLLFEILFIMLFLSVNGHHIFFLIISKSFDAFSIGAVADIEMLSKAVLEASSAMLILGLRLAAPILAAFMVLMVVLAILARISPEMNILFISLPVRIGLGLIMSIIFLPYLYSFIEEFQNWLGKIIPV